MNQFNLIFKSSRKFIYLPETNIFFPKNKLPDLIGSFRVRHSH